MKRYKRMGKAKEQYSKQKKEEKPNNIVVPGIRIFENGYFLKWLDTNPSSLNLSLFYNKFVRWYEDENNLMLKMAFDKYEEGDGKIKIDYKRKHLEKIVELSGKPLYYYEKLKDRFFFDKNHSFLLKTKTRLIVGFAGSGSVLENSIFLHPLYGFPFIPGSSLKGATSHYCREYEINVETREKIFGTESKKGEDAKEGEVVFMDGWPEKWQNKLLELDVMSPHYTDYYAGNKFPSDDSDPIPIIFLAVPKGIEFRFSLLPSRTCEDLDILGSAVDYLKKALINIGIGAKTGSSYGYFEEV